MVNCSKDLSDYLSPLQTRGVEFRGETERRFALLDRAVQSEPLQNLLRERWRRDPVAFINDCVWTFDSRVDDWKHRPMVLWGKQPDFCRVVMGLAPHSRNRRGKMRPVVLKKSRDEGASVMAAALIVWDWLFNLNSHGVMTRAGYQLDGGGYNSLFGKIDYTIRMLPAWLVPWRDTKAGRDARTKRPPVWTHPDDPEAVIMGSTTVDGGWRGPRMRRIWVDEAAWIPAMREILTSIEGATDAPVLISSVAGKGNCFYMVEQGEGRETTDMGVQGDGWIRLRLHYSDNPSKDAEWVTIKRAGMTAEAWAQEYEGDYSASAPGRIWPEFKADKHVLRPSEWKRVVARADEEGWEVIEGWDYGVSSLTAVVWSLYDARQDVLYLADYGSWRERRIDEIARDVGAYGWACSYNPDGIEPTRRVGDPAGANRDSMLHSPVSNLAEYAIRVQSQRIKNGAALRDMIRLKIAEDRIRLAPGCKVRKDIALPSLSDCLEQYRRKDPTGTDPTPKKDDYSHAADALQYICASIWQHSPEVSMIYQR